MSIWLAEVNGKIVKSIVDRNFKKFCIKVRISLLDFVRGNLHRILVKGLLATKTFLWILI